MAGIQTECSVSSSSCSEAATRCAREAVKSFLLQVRFIVGIKLAAQAWKRQQAPMEGKVPQYKREPRQEDIPRPVEQPSLRVCQVVDSVLILPRDVRAQFLHDPCVGPEWRAILAEFDRTWSSNPVPNPAAAPSPEKSVDSPIKAKLQDPGTDFQWASVFAEAPTTFEELKNKFGSDLLEMAGPTSAYSFAVGPGPHLYVIAKEPVELKRRPSSPMELEHGFWVIRARSSWRTTRAVECCANGRLIRARSCSRRVRVQFHVFLLGSFVICL